MFREDTIHSMIKKYQVRKGVAPIKELGGGPQNLDNVLSSDSA
jgi:hypothetical protein